MEFEMSLTQRGKEKIHCQGYSYTLKKVLASGEEWWECDKRRIFKCHARLLKVGNKVDQDGSHVHSSDPVSTKVQVLRVEMKDKAKSTRDNPAVIVRASTAGVSEPVSARLPTRNTMARTIRNARRYAEGYRTPANLEELWVPNDLQQALSGGDFLQWDSWPEDTRILIFASQKGLEILSESRVWHLDGTFKSAPLLFTQLYTIHGYIRGKSFPLVFCLLPDKRQVTYRKMLEKVKQLRDGMDPHVIVVDFERAALNALRVTFPTAEIKGCSFHFHQCLWRKIQAIPEISERYKTDIEYASEIKKLGALGFRKLDDVRVSYEVLTATPFFQRPEIKELLDYFEQTWVGVPQRPNFEGWTDPIFPIRLWKLHDSVENGNARTNNGVEGWHYRFQSMLGCNHPNIFKFIEELRLEEDSIRVEITRLEAGGKISPRKRAYRDIDNKLLGIFEDYENISPLGFLRRVSHVITLG